MGATVHALRESTRPTKDDGAVLSVPLSQIDHVDTTFRFRLALDVDDLTASLSRDGQLIPVVLRSRGKADQFQILCGFRRLAAMRSLGFTYVSAIVRDGLSDEDAFTLAVTENTQRKNFNDLDRGHAIVQSRERFGTALKDIAARMNLTTRQVMRLEKLTSFPTFVQEAITARRIPATHALVLMEHFGAEGPELMLRSWLVRLERSRMSVLTLRAQLMAEQRERAKGRRRPIPALALFEERERPNGRRVVRFYSRTLALDAMTAEDREQVVAELQRLLAVVHDSRTPPGPTAPTRNTDP